MPRYNKVYIIGFMGSGKTTAGKRLACLMGWSFIDLDKKIEERCGMKIAEIFASHGEDFFRKTESDVLKSLDPHSETVISTGGGTPCYEDNMDYMINTGLTVYLKLTPGQLKERLSGSKGERPLISGIPKEKLQDFIEEKLSLREKWYNRAGLIVEGINVDINLLKNIIVSDIGRHS
jgi:shikimate kinase